MRSCTLALRAIVVLAFLVAAHAVPRNADAYDFEVTARSELYSYQLRQLSATGIGLLNRRRFTQLLGFRVFNLLDDGQQVALRNGKFRPPALLYMSTMLRFSVDFGGYAKQATGMLELRDNQFELLLGSLEGRNLWGWVDFSLGRQYDWELADIFAYDGLRIRINTPWSVFIESYAGLRVNRNAPFSTVVLVPDGTTGDAAIETALGPTFGVALGLESSRLVLRLAYRGVASLAPAQSGEGSRWGVDQELIFAEIELPVQRLGSRLGAALRYNLLTASYDELQLRWHQALGERYALEAEFLRSRPHFDGDSIFNVFATEPFDEFAFRSSLKVRDGGLLEARASYRVFGGLAAGDMDDAVTAAIVGSWRISRWRSSAELFFLHGGSSGSRYGGDFWIAWTSRPFWDDRRLLCQGRTSLARFEGSRAGSAKGAVTSLATLLGVGLQVLPEVRLSTVVEHTTSAVFAADFRVLSTVDMEFQP